MVVPPKHPKTIMFSRKKPWSLGTTILGNPQITPINGGKYRELGFFYPEICGVVGAHLAFTPAKPIYFWGIYRSELILWANNNCSEQTARWLGISAENMVVKSKGIQIPPKNALSSLRLRIFSVICQEWSHEFIEESFPWLIRISQS